jgi:hypothetical protein
MTVYDFKIALYKFLENTLGQKYVHQLFLRRSVRMYRDKGLVFVHIPKSAGTTVANEVLGRRAGHFTAVEIADEMGLDDFSGLFSFTVVRNPYDRLVSAYHYARQGGGSEGSIRKLDVYNSPAFESFESFIHNWLIVQDLMQVPIVFRPQYLFVCNDNDEVLVQYIAHSEQLEELSDMLKKTVNLTTGFNQLNTTSRQHYSKYYTEELCKIVYELYRKDFEMFGYNSELIIE